MGFQQDSYQSTPSAGSSVKYWKRIPLLGMNIKDVSDARLGLRTIFALTCS
jgi:hypothetical protein